MSYQWPRPPHRKHRVMPLPSRVPALPSWLRLLALVTMTTTLASLLEAWILSRSP
jgi:hypothetical protein